MATGFFRDYKNEFKGITANRGDTHQEVDVRAEALKDLSKHVVDMENLGSKLPAGSVNAQNLEAGISFVQKVIDVITDINNRAVESETTTFSP